MGGHHRDFQSVWATAMWKQEVGGSLHVTHRSHSLHVTHNSVYM